MIDKPVPEFLLTQDRLSPHFRPDRFADSPLNKLFIFLLGLSPPGLLAIRRELLSRATANRAHARL
jgi:hypothetical protein